MFHMLWYLHLQNLWVDIIIDTLHVAPTPGHLASTTTTCHSADKWLTPSVRSLVAAYSTLAQLTWFWFLYFHYVPWIQTHRGRGCNVWLSLPGLSVWAGTASHSAGHSAVRDGNMGSLRQLGGPKVSHYQSNYYWISCDLVCHCSDVI